jgi:hypothetical protein
LRLSVTRRKGGLNLAHQILVDAQVTVPFRNRPDGLASRLDGLTALRDTICEKALAAIESKYRAELSYRCSKATTLFDCSFAFTKEGLRAYGKALRGELCFEAGRHVRLHKGVLSHEIRRLSTVELHLPFMSRGEWKSGLDSLAGAEIQGEEEGRLLAYTVPEAQRIARKNSYQSVLALSRTLAAPTVHANPNFTLAYTDRRKLRGVQLRTALMPMLEAYGFDGEIGQWLATVPKAQSEVETTLTLSVPGQAAAAWLRGPGERDADFAGTYARMSVAVQRAMRNWLPFVYFSDLNRYDRTTMAYPLLVYQCSRPFPGKGRTEFTYDVMDRHSTARARRKLSPAVTRELERVEQLLVDAGKTDTAQLYAPKRAPKVLTAVENNPRMLDSLLYADSVFVEQLIQLGIHAGKLAHGEQTAMNLALFVRSLVKTFHGRLKRLYGRQEYLSFGSLLLVEATSALGAALGCDAPLRAVLTIAADDVKHTFVNSSYQQ